MFKARQLQFVLPEPSAFFTYLARSEKLSIFSLSFIFFTQWSAGMEKSSKRQVISLFFFFLFSFVNDKAWSSDLKYVIRF